jgi:ABC-type glycerol-3-phosphate transport system substrate-binding protein
MKRILTSVAMAGLIALAACGGQGDDSLGDNAADRADAQADNLDALADNTSNGMQADTLEQQADALRDQGEAREEAIDDADVNADAMTPQQKDAVTNVQ